MSPTLARIRRDVYKIITNGAYYNTHTSNYIVFNGVLKAVRSKRIKILVESVMIEKGYEDSKT